MGFCGGKLSPYKNEDIKEIWTGQSTQTSRLPAAMESPETKIEFVKMTTIKLASNKSGVKKTMSLVVIFSKFKLKFDFTSKIRANVVSKRVVINDVIKLRPNIMDTTKRAIRFITTPTIDEIDNLKMGKKCIFEISVANNPIESDDAKNSRYVNI